MPKTPQRVNIPAFFLRLVFTHRLSEKKCTHLRMCLVCSYVGCCDTSKNRHMHKHIKGTGHRLIRSIEEGEGWIWCYPDKAYISANSRQLDEAMPTS